MLPQLVDSSIRELERLREHLEPRRLQAATELVLGADAVFLLAQRRAFPVAAYLPTASRSSRSAPSCSTRSPGCCASKSAAIRRGNVLIAASFRNYSAEVIEAAELAHKQGAVVIAITDQPCRRWSASRA